MTRSVNTILMPSPHCTLPHTLPPPYESPLEANDETGRAPHALSSVLVCLRRHAEEYGAEVVLRGALGEEPRRVRLRGAGSLDGTHEALLNA